MEDYRLEQQKNTAAQILLHTPFLNLYAYKQALPPAIARFRFLQVISQSPEEADPARASSLGADLQASGGSPLQPAHPPAQQVAAAEPEQGPEPPRPDPDLFDEDPPRSDSDSDNESDYLSSIESDASGDINAGAQHRRVGAEVALLQQRQAQAEARLLEDRPPHPAREEGERADADVADVAERLQQYHQRHQQQQQQGELQQQPPQHQHQHQEGARQQRDPQRHRRWHRDRPASA